MVNEEHFAILKKGVEVWNKWRNENPSIEPDLSGAYFSKTNLGEAFFSGLDLSYTDLSKTNLSGFNLTKTNLVHANLSRANLSTTNLSEAHLNFADLSEADLSHSVIRADLRGAKLYKANLNRADLFRAYLCKTNLVKANLNVAYLSKANLTKADLSGANLRRAYFYKANLRKANFSEAKLRGADFSEADLREANLSRADISGTRMIGAKLNGAILTHCRVFGVSAWGLTGLEEAEQSNLVITPDGEPKITVDNLEVAQFIYLLINNQKLRSVIDTITTKVVLILGRFTTERKIILDALREELRKRSYIPVLFDFEKPKNRNMTETIKTLAGMSRFIIADITEAKSVIQELTAIVPFHPSVPVKPIILKSAYAWGMFDDFNDYSSVLKVYKYKNKDGLVKSLNEKIIDPAENKANKIQKRRERR